MTPTPVGIVVFILTLGMLFFGRQNLWLLLIAILPLQAAAVLTWEGGDRETGLNPRYFVMLIACVAALPSFLQHLRSATAITRRWKSVAVPAILFLTWAVFGAYILPRLLSGTVTVHPYTQVKAALLEPMPSNLRHALYLSTCVFSFLMLAMDVGSWGPKYRRRAILTLRVSGWTAVGMILWHMLYFYSGVPFPVTFFLSNPGASLNMTGAMRPELGFVSNFVRPSGSFSEPSLAAMYLSGFLAFTLAEFLNARRTVGGAKAMAGVILLIIVMIVLTSTTGYVSGLLILGWWGAAQIRRLSFARPVLLGVVLAGVSALVLIWQPALGDELVALYNLMMTDKVASDAGGRGQLEVNALRVFADSYGLGAGIGSNMALSLGSYLISSVGAIGVGLLIWFGVRVNRVARAALKMPAAPADDIRTLAGFVAGILLAGFVAVEVLMEPALWIVTALLVGLSIGAKPVRLARHANYDPGRDLSTQDDIAVGVLPPSPA